MIPSKEEESPLELVESDLDRLRSPHQFLGLQKRGSKQVIRILRPGARKVQLQVFDQVYEAKKVDEKGLFECEIDKPISSKDYKVFYPSGLLAHDPYVEKSRIQREDLECFKNGNHYEIYSFLGAKISEDGVQFALWAPRAKAVFLKGDFNHWHPLMHPMREVEGVWELFVPGLKEGEKYKFEIHTEEGYVREKSDPMAFFSELRPHNASVCFDIDRYKWQDKEWKRKGAHQPINIYEVHLGSWKKYRAEFPNYREIAIDLAAYVKEMGFSHIELLPIMEHPLDESWGYQVTGFFSVTSRYGTPEDFQFFVDHMHVNGIGVILDWVPGHFPMDAFSLSDFDGKALYEYADPRKGVHPHWHTSIFDYGRKEVICFLIASAFFWHKKMHIDGIRVDAVASMLYLDYGRKKGEWIPNRDGGNINYDAVQFLKKLNQIIHETFPNTLMFAEESSIFQGVTHSEGLGFDFKWNMGWMNDTLHYFSKDPIYRKFHQRELTFALMYAFSEKFACVLSHDEVVHEKKSILSKMPGPDVEKFANVRLLYSYMLAHPGKNLIFMGAEIGQWGEWAVKDVLDWAVLNYPLHKALQIFFKEINLFYKAAPALWEYDHMQKGFEWVDFSDAANSMISYVRRGETQTLLCIHNFTPVFRPKYFIPYKAKVLFKKFSTDETHFGGSGAMSEMSPVSEKGFYVDVPGLSTLIFEV